MTNPPRFFPYSLVSAPKTCCMDTFVLLHMYIRTCERSRAFVIIVRSITPDPSGNDDNEDAQSVTLPLLNGSNNPIAVSDNATLEPGQVWPSDTFLYTNAPPPLVPREEKSKVTKPVQRLCNSSPKQTWNRNRAMMMVPQRHLGTELSLR